MSNLRSLPMKIRLPLIIVGLGLVTSAVVGWVGYAQVEKLAVSEVASNVVSVAVGRQAAVESYYDELSRDISDMATGPTILAGYRRLLLGWTSSGADPAAMLIAEYITNNPHPPGSRMKLDRAPGVDTYDDQHGIFHPAFRNWVQLHQYYDFFLINLDGDIIYTVAKESDFATNLKTGPEATGPLAYAFTQALVDPAGGVHFSQFAHYGPSNGDPAAFAARVILDETGQVIGVMAIQISNVVLDDMVNSPTDLKATGEVYLATPDRIARTPSRFPGGFQTLDQLADLPQLAKDTKPGNDLLQHVPLTSGQIGSTVTIPVDIPGLDWQIVVEFADSEAFAPVYAARDTLALLTLGAAVVVGLIGAFLSRGITAPIIRITEAIKTIANGNLDAAISDADRQDELGDIAKSLDALRQKLGVSAEMEAERARQSDAQGVVVEALSVGLRDLSSGNLAQSIDQVFGADYEGLRGDFNQTVDKLHETITLVVDTSQSIRPRSREISQSSEDLSGRTETQAATLEETAAALDQLTSSIRSAAEGAREVEGIVRAARGEAEESGKVVQGAVAAMTEIERSSDQISQIIGVIDDIAFQTNLLALNAGVEAARAGDAGRGFAVVAAEVRALAQRSSMAAKEIKVLISASTQHVGRGVQQVGRAGEALDSIVARVGHISTLVTSIASAAAEQATGLAEINLGVTHLDQVTQQNAAMVEQSTAASQSLNQEAAGLTELVAQFQIRRQPGRRTGADAPEHPRLAVAAPEPPRTAAPRDLAPRSRPAAVGQGIWQDF